MSKQLAGFPFWEAAFDENGKLRDSRAMDRAIAEIAAADLTDLFIFSHGWNNDRNMAHVLYDGFFQQVRKLIDDPGFPKKRAARCGVMGIFWPSILWPDEQAAAAHEQGGAAGLNAAQGAKANALATVEDLSMVFGAEHEDTIRRLLALLQARQGGEDALRECSEMIASLFTGKKIGIEDSLEADALGSKPQTWRKAFELLGDEEATEGPGGGAAGIGDELRKLWDGAKGALRVTTYWQMKSRAGVVGKNGLGPLIGQIAKAAPEVRLHLLGHSFGARLVSYALAGLDAPAATSQIKSLFLLQGAFSHFTFAAALPFDQTRSGDLKGKDKLIDGPLLTTFSELDLAVGRAYPLASIVAGADNSKMDEIVSRWGGMGSDGAQAVNAKPLQLKKAGFAYNWTRGGWHNLDGNQIIKNGGLPSGAHSDIIHPETAWATLSAAGIV